MFLKRVSKMVMGKYLLQYWIWTRVLSVSCGWVHHTGSLNFTRTTVLICKLCLVTPPWPLNVIKFESKMITNYKIIFKKIWPHVQLGQSHGTNGHPSPFRQYKAALNTICSRMKSRPRYKHCWLLVPGTEQVDFWTSYTVLRRATSCHVPASQCKYKSGSDRHWGDLLRSPTEF